VVFAQTPPLDSGDAHIHLTAAQKQTVYQSVSKAQKNNAPQRAFRATVGPLRLGETSRPFRRPSPTSCRKGLESAMVEGQVGAGRPLLTIALRELARVRASVLW
jgi:hypothetical protein